jgi:hypothetical protein
LRDGKNPAYSGTLDAFLTRNLKIDSAIVAAARQIA